MRSDRRMAEAGIAMAILGAVLVVIFGCAVVGPTSISSGRAEYCETIDKTEDEQLSTVGSGG